MTRTVELHVRNHQQGLGHVSGAELVLQRFAQNQTKSGLEVRRPAPPRPRKARSSLVKARSRDPVELGALVEGQDQVLERRVRVFVLRFTISS